MYIDKRGFHCISHRFSIPGDSICKETGGCTIFDATRDGGHAFSLHGWNDTWYCADGKGGHAHCTPDQPPAYNATIVCLASFSSRNLIITCLLQVVLPRASSLVCLYALAATTVSRCTNRAACTSLGLENDHMFYSMAIHQWQSPTLSNTARLRTSRMFVCLEIHIHATKATRGAIISGRGIKTAVGQRSLRCARPSSWDSMLNVSDVVHVLTPVRRRYRSEGPKRVRSVAFSYTDGVAAHSRRCRAGGSNESVHYQYGCDTGHKAKGLMPGVNGSDPRRVRRSIHLHIPRCEVANHQRP